MFRNLLRDAGGRAHEVADRASDYAHHARDSAREYADRLSDRAGDYAGQVRHYARDYAEHIGESPIAHTAAKVPTDLFLIAAGGSIVGSLVLKLMGRRRDAEFVGNWAPTLLALGLLSKLVEHDEHGHRR